MLTNYSKWLEKSKRQLITAHLNNDNHGFRDTTCYFAYQTVELALKAFLVAYEVDFPKIHALPQLLSLCISKNADFTAFKDDTALLNGYYIEAKYPLDITFDPTKEETIKALETADRILKFVELKI